MRELLLSKPFVESIAKEFHCKLVELPEDTYRPECSWFVRLDTGIPVCPTVNEDDLYGELIVSGIAHRYEVHRKRWGKLNQIEGLYEHSFLTVSTHKQGKRRTYVVDLFLCDEVVSGA